MPFSRRMILFNDGNVVNAIEEFNNVALYYGKLTDANLNGVALRTRHIAEMVQTININ